MHLFNMAIGIYLAIGVVATLIAADKARRARAWQKKALSYVRRDSNGNLYAQDPQTGTWHRLMIGTKGGQVVVEPRKRDDRLTARQKKRLRRQARQHS